MPNDVVSIRIDTFDEAARAWESGLRHGMATTAVTPPPKQGMELIVVFDLRYADRSLRVPGIVSHTAAEHAAIWMQQVPDELKQLCTVEPVANEAAPGPATEPATGARARGKARKPLTETVHRVVRPPRSPDAERDVQRRKKLARAPTIPPPLPPRTQKVFKVPSSPAAGQAARADAPPPQTAPTSRPVMAGAEAEVASGPGIPTPRAAPATRPGIVLFTAAADDGGLHPHLLRISAEKLDGLAVFEAGGHHAWMWFCAGVPVRYLCGPHGPGEMFVDHLVEEQAITSTVADHAGRLADVTATDPSIVLQRLDLVEAGKLAQLHRTWLGRVVTRLLDADSGTLRFFELPEVPRLLGPGHLDLTPLIWHHTVGTISRIEDSRLHGHLTGMRRMYASITDTGRRSLGILPLDEAQRGFVEQMSRPDRPVRSLLKRKLMSRRDAATLMLALRQLGVMALSPHAPENHEEVELERRLRDVFGRMHADHFGFLDLHWSALPEEIEVSCGHLDEQIHAFSGLADSITNFNVMRDALLNRLAEIRGLVGDAGERCDYRAALVSEDERGMAAVTYMEQGEMALHHGHGDEAAVAFRRVLEIDPGDLSSIDRVQRATFVLEALLRGETPPPAG